MKISHYCILEKKQSSNLEELVVERIKQGWQPLGGVSVTQENGRMTYVQAMVKYEEPAE